jgi:hypothetical protein
MQELAVFGETENSFTNANTTLTVTSFTGADLSPVGSTGWTLTLVGAGTYVITYAAVAVACVYRLEETADATNYYDGVYQPTVVETAPSGSISTVPV